MTKAQEVFEKVEALMAAGTSKADAFKQLAAEYGQPVNSIRGSYYQHTRKAGGEKRKCQDLEPDLPFSRCAKPTHPECQRATNDCRPSLHVPLFKSPDCRDAG